MIYICGKCGYVYEEREGDTEIGIIPGTKWDELQGFACPDCSAAKDEFNEAEP